MTDYTIYSREYRRFKEEEFEAKKPKTLYEKFCKISYKLLKIKVSEKDKRKVEGYINIAHLNVTPEEAYSFATLSLLFLLILAIVFLFINRMLAIVMAFSSFSLFFFLRQYPAHLAAKFKVKVVEEIPFAVMYMVMYMRNNPSLEGAVRFAVKHLPGAMGLELKKLLWDVHIRIYSNVEEAIEANFDRWEKFLPELVEAFRLMIISTRERIEEKRVDILNKALNITLHGLKERMEKYARDLTTPIKIINALGIILPVLTLSLMPVVGMFMAEKVKPLYLFAFYDIIIPGLVFFISRNVLEKRPGGFKVDISLHPKVPSRGRFKLLGREIPAIYVAMIVAILGAIPFILNYKILFSGTEEAYQIKYIFHTLALVDGIGLAVFVYAYLISKDRSKIRESIRKIESKFDVILFQLGNLLEEGLPLEIAFEKCYYVMKTPEFKKFFQITQHNLQFMTLEDALFDPEYGSLRHYPSRIIRSILKVITEAYEKGVKIAARLMIACSEYLTNIKKVELKLEDLLAETVASMRFVACYLAPVISGLIVGVGVLIMTILLKLSEELEKLRPASATDIKGYLAIGFFEISQATPPAIFQLIVGLYAVEVSILLAYLASAIENDDDEVAMLSSLKRILLNAVSLYTLTLILTSAILSMFVKALF